MAKKVAKMKSLSTNVRYIKAKQRGTHVYLHTTGGLGHKRILKDNAVVDFVTAYIFNGQIQSNEKLRRKNDQRY